MDKEDQHKEKISTLVKMIDEKTQAKPDERFWSAMAGAAIYGRVTGGGGPTLPTVPVAPASNKTVTQTNHVTVSAPNADAKQVVDMINDQLDMRLREAAAAIP